MNPRFSTGGTLRPLAGDERAYGLTAAEMRQIIREEERERQAFRFKVLTFGVFLAGFFGTGIFLL